MRVGFDAKRYHQNSTGLGNYSRWLIHGLKNKIDLVLFTPAIQEHAPEIKTVQPTGAYSVFKSIWRNRGILRDLKSHNIDIYHGLSNAIPFGIHKTKIKSIVTIHDVINLTYPQYYSKLDNFFYKQKLKYAVSHADVIVVPSESTLSDLKRFYPFLSGHVEVIPLSVPLAVEEETVENTPKEFVLCVSGFSQRKNHMRLIEAYEKSGISSPLVLAGKKGDTFEKVKVRCQTNDQITIVQNPTSGQIQSLYNKALFSVYPSEYEGFGIPILESYQAGKAMAVSNTSSMPEVGGPIGTYFNPFSIQEISDALIKLSDASYRLKMEQQIPSQLKQFDSEALLSRYVNLYQSVTN